MDLIAKLEAELQSQGRFDQQSCRDAIEALNQMQEDVVFLCDQLLVRESAQDYDKVCALQDKYLGRH